MHDINELLHRTSLPKGTELDPSGQASASIGGMRVFLRENPVGVLMAMCPMGSIASLDPERTAFVMRGLLKLNLPGEEQSPNRFCMDPDGMVYIAGIFKLENGQEDLLVSAVNGYIDELPSALLRFRSLSGGSSGQDDEDADLGRTPPWG
ncbi:MAG: hypothetical protein ACI4NA_03395 [Succinivibrio sp.]